MSRFIFSSLGSKTDVQLFRVLGEKLPSFCALVLVPEFDLGDNAVQLIEDLQVKQPYIWIYCFLFMAIAAYVILNLVTAVICALD